MVRGRKRVTMRYAPDSPCVRACLVINPEALEILDIERGKCSRSEFIEALIMGMFAEECEREGVKI
jgi:hypothetical protein